MAGFKMDKNTYQLHYLSRKLSKYPSLLYGLAFIPVKVNSKAMVFHRNINVSSNFHAVFPNPSGLK